MGSRASGREIRFEISDLRFQMPGAAGTKSLNPSIPDSLIPSHLTHLTSHVKLGLVPLIGLGATQMRSGTLSTLTV